MEFKYERFDNAGETVHCKKIIGSKDSLHDLIQIWTSGKREAQLGDMEITFNRFHSETQQKYDTVVLPYFDIICAVTNYTEMGIEYSVFYTKNTIRINKILNQ